MRILQIIDSLEAGGAERMAVNYANALAKTISFSGLVVTRKEGALQSELDLNVNYLFLNKQSVLDRKAIKLLISYCKEHKIEVLHAHTSSYFIAVVVKFFCPKIAIIWHDHYGLSEFLNHRKSFYLSLASFFFKGIVVVNYQLKAWAEAKLYCKHIVYLPNFTTLVANEVQETFLEGTVGHRILCLANLRPQKNHEFLLKVAKSISSTYPDWTFHLVGKDFQDAYALKIKTLLVSLGLEQHVFIYGSQKDIQHIISQSTIAILTSSSEGLPISLLEYGLHKKAVVTTAVGEIPNIIKNKENGFIVDKEDLVSFIHYLELLITEPQLRTQMGIHLSESILASNSEQAIIQTYSNWLSNLCNGK